MLGDDELGSVCENDIILDQTLLGCGRGRHHDHEPGTELEREDGTIFLGERMVQTMDGWF